MKIPVEYKCDNDICPERFKENSEDHWFVVAINIHNLKIIYPTYQEINEFVHDTLHFCSIGCIQASNKFASLLERMAMDELKFQSNNTQGENTENIGVIRAS